MTQLRRKSAPTHRQLLVRRLPASHFAFAYRLLRPNGLIFKELKTWTCGQTKLLYNIQYMYMTHVFVFNCVCMFFYYDVLQQKEKQTKSNKKNKIFFPKISKLFYNSVLVLFTLTQKLNEKRQQFFFSATYGLKLSFF